MRVLELFCGIGGLHWALKESEADFEVVGAMEINPHVLEVYKTNFPNVPIMRRNIESLTAADVNDLNVECILMSPPCQPFCRTGNQKGSLDNRSSPLSHLLEILPEINFQYVFVENVHGFEKSDLRDPLINTLQTKCGMCCQEFLLNPSSFGIPNSRLRYYLIGKRKEIPWCFDVDSTSEIMEDIPLNSPKVCKLIEKQKNRWNAFRRQRLEKNKLELSEDLSFKIMRSSSNLIFDILEPPDKVSEKVFLSPDKIEKYFSALDIVQPSCDKSCCFTKAYFNYLTGTGSLLDVNEIQKSTTTFPRESKHNLRFFTPGEVSRLLCYPENLKFPPQLSLKQLYKALGNSVNVYIISLLLCLLFE